MDFMLDEMHQLARREATRGLIMNQEALNVEAGED